MDTYYTNSTPTFFQKQLQVMIVNNLVGCVANPIADNIQIIKKILDVPLECLRELLCTPASTIIDPAGRIHKDRTAYQMALGARDYHVESKRGTQVVEGVVEILTDYFKKLPNGEALMQQQYEEQFPELCKIKEQEREKNDSQELLLAYAAVEKASDAHCQRVMALDSFHGYDLRPIDNILPGAIYLEEDIEDGLVYQIRDFTGQVKKGVIAWSQLPADCPRSIDALCKVKYQFLPDIINQIALTGDIYSTKQMDHLKKLSEEVIKAASWEVLQHASQQLIAYLKEQNIINDTDDLTLLQALYRFKNYLEPKGVYTTGHHHNPKLQLNAHHLYNKKFYLFGNDWASPKNVLCWQKIVGSTLRLLPGCDLQVIAQGSYHVLEKGEKSKRSYLFSYSDGSILPFESNAIFRLGYNYATGEGGLVAWRTWPLLISIGFLITSKEISAAKVSPYARRACVMM